MAYYSRNPLQQILKALVGDRRELQCCALNRRHKSVGLMGGNIKVDESILGETYEDNEEV